VSLRIEEELFKLFGGVNKNYKENGLSLLYSLKDKNNPVLRERVLSGDITPKCLCAMTIEELASKELSGWRMAKVEEFANMVVLPDREVDIRRLVRKTQKEDFQIEVIKETDVIEVGLGVESMSYVPSKPVADQTKSDDKTSVHTEVNESDNSVEDGVVGTYNTSNNLEYPPNEKSDLMQEPIIDDLTVTENLPQIMTMDEFMQLLHSESHSEYQATGALQDDPRIDKADKVLKSKKIPTAKDKASASDFQSHSSLSFPQDNYESKLESTMNKSVSVLDPVEEQKGDVGKSPPEKVVAAKPDTLNGSIPLSTLNCKMAVSPKVQMLIPLTSQFSARKRFVQRELSPKANSQVQFFDPMRLKFTNNLAAVLSMDSDHQFEQQSARNVPPLGSAGGNMQAAGGRMQGITTAFQDAGKDDENVTKVATRRSEHGDMSHSNLRPCMPIEVRDDMQQETEHVLFENKVSGNSSVALDDLLQDQGLCWAPDTMSQPNPKRAKASYANSGVDACQIRLESKRAITSDEAIEEKKVRIYKGQSMALRIEEELFKLFGGVNKEYRKKGRSLLFNLKDKNNPVLRERVLSGDITPKCLCAMTFEELASKEISEWPMAKAEGLANMVALPDREVDARCSVRKAHKG
jgi:hypothetical protein